jgi:L-seryl-tRNA(Ser) seleniumtransferase
MSDNVYESLNVPTIINAVGYATRIGGSAPSAAVLEAMRQASESFIEIDDLQRAASNAIADATGAEAGIVTCGAAAALALAGAACLAGNDPDIMDRLPDVKDLARNEIIYPSPWAFGYDHAVRVSGARLIGIDYEADGALKQIERAINPRTAAIGYEWTSMHHRVSVRQVVEIAHRHGLPVIVDGSMSLPPREHMRSFIADGADLVAISGGKHLQGPQASGILCGKRELIASALVQMVDMDVRPQTWSLRHLIDDGFISRPPRHGIGRTMKVGKEQIVGLLAALKAYPHRDHDAELRRWHQHIDAVADALRDANIETKRLFPAPNGQPYPVLTLRTPRIIELIAALREGRPKIILAESETDPTVATICPQCLRDGDAEQIAAAIRKHL